MCPLSPVPQSEVRLWVPVRAAPSPGRLWLTSTSPLSSPTGQSGQDALLPGGFSLGPLLLLGHVFDLCSTKMHLGFPGGASGKGPACQCKRHKRCWFSPWVGKIPWRRTWQPTPVFLSGESPWTEKPGGLQFMGSQRFGHDWMSKHVVIFKRGHVLTQIKPQLLNFG